MDDRNTRNPEYKEIVGSTDLREVFNKHQRVRGSFYINHIEMHQFEANTPASVVSQINAKTPQHFVHAELDDGGHLVLVDKSGADILLRLGNPYVDPPTASTGDAAKDALHAIKKAADEDRGPKKDEESVLQLLGLDGAMEKTKDAPASASRPGFQTGASAEDRKKRHDAERGMPDDSAVQKPGRYPKVGGQRLDEPNPTFRDQV